MRTLYFDCFAGASGNMILGALIGLGVDQKELITRLNLLDLPEFGIDFTTADRAGISAIHAFVKVPREDVYRGLADIETIIRKSKLSKTVKERAVLIFTRLAEAEATVHGIGVQEVHFHEVGAMDAIIDVVGACIGFELLGIESFACSKVHTGSGFVQIAHGKYPVPAPAAVELLRGVPIFSTEIEGELITPTGAAIITTLCDSYGQIPEMKVEEISYGAGSREYPNFSNVLRLLIGEGTGNATGQDDVSMDKLIMLETNIDDLSPQILGYVMERAFESGALDCWFTPIQMKKNRPATVLSVLCKPEARDDLMEMIFSETSTLGIRVRPIERVTASREIETVQTKFGRIDIKIGRYAGEIVNAAPEYEQVKRLALENGVPFRIVRDAALEKFSEQSASAWA